MAEEVSILGSIEALQVIGLIISGFLLTKAVIDFKRNKIGKWGFIFWCILWSTAFITFAIPKLTQTVFSALETGDVFIIGLVLANIVLFVLVYILFVQLFSVNKQLKLLVQKLALSEKLNIGNKDEQENSEKRTKND